MINATELRTEIEQCLRAGPQGWTTCKATLSPAAAWIVQAAGSTDDVRALIVDFCRQFSRDEAARSCASMAIDMLRLQESAQRNWETRGDPDISDAFPAAELIVVIPEEAPQDWRERWVSVGGKIVSDRAVGLHTDATWAKFSAYGQPFPPFQWGGGLDVEDVDREEAIELGLLKS